MTPVQEILVGVGFVAVCFAAFLIVAAICGTVYEWVQRRKRARRNTWQQKSIQEAGDLLQRYSWWFSEDTPTQDLIGRLGRYMDDNGEMPSRYAWTQLRDAWRKSRAPINTQLADQQPQTEATPS